MQEIANNIFTSETMVKFSGVTIQTRMAVVRLKGNALFIYSPIFLSSEIKNELDAIGEVKYIISPNKIHNQALSDYVSSYPNAAVYASPGLPERRPDINYKTVLQNTPEKEWEEELDQVLTKGNVFFSEALFYHKASKTLLVCDFVENMDKTTTSSRILFKLFGVKEKPMASPEFRLYTMEAEAARLALDKVRAWNFERIFLCHGACIEDNANEIFETVCDEFLAAVKNKSALSRMFCTFISKYQ